MVPSVTAVDDSYTVSHDHGFASSDNGLTVLDNDSDSNGMQTLNVVAVNGDQDQTAGITLPSGAVLTMDGDGSFWYTPINNLVYIDTFTYTALDSDTGESDTATVTIHVVNHAPVISSVTLDNPSPQTNDTLWATASATDADDDYIAYTYVWYVNGAAVQTMPDAGPTDSFLDLRQDGFGDEGDSIYVLVAPYDGMDTGYAGSSDTATVAGTLTLDNPGDQSNTDGDTVDLGLSAAGPEGDALAFSASNLPPGLAIDPDTGEITGTLTSDADSGGPYSVTLTATDSTANLSAAQTISWAVRANPVISWANPADITYGTPLGADQLNATADVSGDFTYSTVSGTVLNAGGDQELQVTFTPNDTTKYAVATKSVHINVLPAPLTITANDQSATYGDTLPALTYTVTSGSLVNGDSVTGALTTDAGNAGDVLAHTFGVDIGFYGITQGSLAAGSNYNLTFNPGMLIINPRSLSVTGISASNKTYDATTAAVLSFDSPALSGVLNGDDVALDIASYSADFDTKDAGTGIGVTPDLQLTGAQAGNYVLAQPTGLTANITKATLTASGLAPSDKVYDGTTLATVDLGTATLEGVFAGDTVLLDTGDAVANFVSSQVGNGVTITVTGLNITGSDAPNYVLADPVTSANITPRALSIVADDYSKPYGQSLTIPGSKFGVSGLASGDSVTSVMLTSAGTDASATAPGSPYPIVPSAATGTGLTNYIISYVDGSMTVNDTNDDPSPVFDQVDDRHDIEGRTVTFSVNATDPNNLAITYEAIILPDGLSINPSSGQITGKLSYTSSGTYVATITATNANNDIAVLNFNWVVDDASIEDLQVSEINGTTDIGNRLTVTGITNDVLWISSGNLIKLVVSPPAGGQAPLWTDVLFRINTPGVSPGSGDFSAANWPIITLPTTANNFAVTVGIDLNQNGVLDVNEWTQTLLVRYVSFAGNSVGSQRVSAPTESTLFPILSGEHFEIGGRFRYSLIGSLAGSNSNIHFDLLNGSTILRTDVGTSIVHQLTAAGSLNVRFYADKNGNGQFDSGEEFLLSPSFTVLAKKIYNIKYNVSLGVGGVVPAAGSTPVTAATVANAQGFQPIVDATVFQGAANVLLRKDSATDFRAAIGFTSEFLGYFSPSALRPDAARTFAEQVLLFDLPADVVFISSLNGPEGMTRAVGPSYWHQIIIAWDAVQRPGPPADTEYEFATTFAHEFGHGVGNDHPEPNTIPANMVMTSIAGGAANELTQSEALNYDTNGNNS